MGRITIVVCSLIPEITNHQWFTMIPLVHLMEVLTCNCDQYGITQKLRRKLRLYSAVHIMVYQRQAILDGFEKGGGCFYTVTLCLFLNIRTLPELTVGNPRV